MVRTPYYGIYLEQTERGVTKLGKFLSDNDQVMDSVSEMELRKADVIMRKKKGEIDCELFSYKLILKIRVFFKLIEDDIDTLTMYFAQSLEDVQLGKMPVQDGHVITLAALALYADFGEFSVKIESSLSTDTMKRYIPQTIYSKRPPEVWQRMIMDSYTQMSEMERIDAKFSYLDIIRQFDLFMSQQFECLYDRVEGEGKEKK